MKPLKYASDDDVYTKLHESLLISDVGDGEDKETHSKYVSTIQSSGEEDVTLGNDVRPQLDFHQARS